MGYLSAPMSAATAESRNRLRFAALEASLQLWEGEALHYCPHAASPAIGTTDVEYERWMAMDLEVLRRCDWIVMVGDWAKSAGCKREFNLAQSLGIPVAFSVAEALQICLAADQRLQEAS
jgi:hypothetical protein